MIRKLGSVFLLSGLLLVVVFFLSPSLGIDHIYFCLSGAGLILASFLLNRVGADRRRKSQRFQTLRKVFGSNHAEEEER